MSFECYSRKLSESAVDFGVSLFTPTRQLECQALDGETVCEAVSCRGSSRQIASQAAIAPGMGATPRSG